jgi:triphosphoribosyl-dephospho-CoA synthase
MSPAALASPVGVSVAVACRAAGVGRSAVLALYDELELAPKPGLVSFVDSGSHCDMDARTFMRSLFSLRRAFPVLAVLGAQEAPLEHLQAEGIAAEARMAAATGGINTHRGAIFSLGLLCAATGRCIARGEPVRAPAVRQSLLDAWGAELAVRARRDRPSNGSHAARRFGLRGAGEEAADGFPVLFDHAWPALRDALASGLSYRRARLHALFATMAVLDDTNIVHRGGMEGLRFVQRAARGYLAAAGTARPDADADAHAWSLHREFIARNLSPGGSADLVAAACWLRRVCEAH